MKAVTAFKVEARTAGVIQACLERQASCFHLFNDVCSSWRRLQPPPPTHTQDLHKGSAAAAVIVCAQLVWTVSLIAAHTLPPPCVHIRAINSPPSVLHCAENQWC